MVVFAVVAASDHVGAAIAPSLSAFLWMPELLLLFWHAVVVAVVVAVAVAVVVIVVVTVVGVVTIVAIVAVVAILTNDNLLEKYVGVAVVVAIVAVVAVVAVNFC